MHLGLLEERALILQRVPDELVELQPFALKLDLVSRDPGDIQKIVDQSGELIDLSLDDGLGPARLVTPRSCAAQDVQAVLDGSQRVAQLVGQHGKKLVLALIGPGELEVGHPQGLLGLLHGREVDRGNANAGDLSGVVPGGDQAQVQEHALPIRRQPELLAHLRTGFHGLALERHQAGRIVGRKQVGVGLAKHLRAVDRALVERPEEAQVAILGRDRDRGITEGEPEPLLTLAQRRFGLPSLRDVEDERQDRERARRIVQGGVVPFAMDDRAVFADVAVLVDVARTLATEHVRHDLLHQGPVLGVDPTQLVDALADGLLAGPAKNSARLI